MTLSRKSLCAFGLLLALPAGVLKAETAQPSAAETKLRESLRNTMLQLRTSENDKAVAQAALSEAEDKNKALTEQLEKTTKEKTDQKLAADKAATELQIKVDERDKIIGEYKDVLEKAKAEIKRISDIATTTEAQRVKLQDQSNQLSHRVNEQQTKNANMYRIANEILQRYEKFGLGDALTAREPFTGITRVKLQSLFEEYQDKIDDQRIKPEATTTPAGKATPAPALGKPATKTKSTQNKSPEQKPKS